MRRALGYIGLFALMQAVLFMGWRLSVMLAEALFG